MCTLKVIVVDVYTSTENEIPKTYELYQNFPNPFNPSTNIKFDIPETSNVKLIVVNLLGEQLDVLINEVMEAGSYNVKWDGANYSSGIYFCKIISLSQVSNQRYVKVQKMLMIK